jgi:hypothetical protein
MTPELTFDVPVVLAAAAPPDGGVSPLVQLIPFALILAIFYLHHPAADEAAAEEGSGVSRWAQGR